MKRWVDILHSFLIALSPVLFLYAHNIEQVLIHDTFLSALILVGLAIIILAVFFVTLRSLQKAAILTSIFLLLFFSYGQLYSLRQEYDLRERYLVGGLLASLAAAFLWLYKTRIGLSRVTRFLNVFAIVFVVFSLVSIGRFKINETSPSVDTRSGPQVTATAERPDIYYFLVDGYASQWELSNFYGNDNKQFIDYLKQKGFYVVPESRSNYAKTEFSLSTILNLDYLEGLSATGQVSSETIRPPRLLQNHRVWQFLKPLGYKYFHFGSWWEGTYNNRYADVNVNQGYMPEFPQLLYRSIEQFLPFEPAFLDVRRLQWERTLYQFSELPKIPKREDKKPVFVFVHFITHSPFVFNEDGSFLKNEASKVSDSGKQDYLNQLLFLNKKLEVLVESILKTSKTPPIIVIQSDHGSRDTADENVSDARDYSDEYLRRRLRNFSAFYLPDGGDGSPYETITPVNTFRLLFNKYFGTNYEILPNKSFITLPGSHYDLIDVTERVVYE